MQLRYWVVLPLAFVGCKKKPEDKPGVAPIADGSGSGGSGSGSAEGKGALPKPGGTKLEFVPNAQGFKFQNYGNEDGVENLTPAELRRMFGDEVCAEIGDDGICTLTPPAERWMDETNKGMDGGHCEGMATLSLLFDVKKLDPKDFGAPNAFALELAGNKKLQHELAYWFSTQYIEPVASAEIKTLTPSEIVDKLAASFATPTDPYTIGIYMADWSGGHATTPYAIVEKSPELAWIMHYDNNFPGEERHIDVDRKANTWTYVTASDPKEPEGTYAGDAETKTLTIAPTSPRFAKLVCPFCGEVDDAADDAVRAKGSRQIMLDGDADLIVTDDSGKRIGMVDGKLVNEIAGARAITAKVGTRRAEEEPIYEVPSGKKLTVTLDGGKLAKEEATDVSLVANGYTMGVYGVELEPKQKDTLTFSADWKHVSYATEQDATPDLELAVTTTTADWEFDVNAEGEAGGQTVELDLDVKAGTFAVEAHAKDGSSTYEVEIRRYDDKGVTVFKHKGIASGGKDRFVFKYAEWKGEGTKVKVGVDHGDDGSIDEDEELGDEE